MKYFLSRKYQVGIQFSPLCFVNTGVSMEEEEFLYFLLWWETTARLQSKRNWRKRIETGPRICPIQFGLSLGANGARTKDAGWFWFTANGVRESAKWWFSLTGRCTVNLTPSADPGFWSRTSRVEDEKFYSKRTKEQFPNSVPLDWLIARRAGCNLAFVGFSLFSLCFFCGWVFSRFFLNKRAIWQLQGIPGHFPTLWFLYEHFRKNTNLVPTHVSCTQQICGVSTPFSVILNLILG